MWMRMRSLRKLSKKYYCVSHRGSIPNWAKLFVNSNKNKNKKLNKKINFVFVFVFFGFALSTHFLLVFLLGAFGRDDASFNGTLWIYCTPFDLVFIYLETKTNILMTLFVYLFFLGLPHLRWNGKFFAKKADELRLEFCMENLYLLSGALNTSYSATPKDNVD